MINTAYIRECILVREDALSRDGHLRRYFTVRHARRLISRCGLFQAGL